MKLAEEFFSLQIAFAERMAALTDRPLQSVLLDFTCFYIVFFLDAKFDPNHSVWMEYERGARTCDSVTRWTYRFFLTRASRRPADRDKHFGCFYYRVHEGGGVRNHFANRDESGYGALSKGRIGVRLAELRAMYRYIHEHESSVEVVRGRSWLYNVPAYTRLFPPSCIESATRVEGEFRRLELWGQFLDHDGRLKHDLAEPFLERLSRSSNLWELQECFPFRILATECPIMHFYSFYGV
jgi:hypothetical protein